MLGGVPGELLPTVFFLAVRRKLPVKHHGGPVHRVLLGQGSELQQQLPQHESTARGVHLRGVVGVNCHATSRGAVGSESGGDREGGGRGGENTMVEGVAGRGGVEGQGGGR